MMTMYIVHVGSGLLLVILVLKIADLGVKHGTKTEYFLPHVKISISVWDTI